LIRTTRLGSGMWVVTERMPDVRSVSAGFWVGTGSRDEPADKAGASHFLEHLLFKGTEQRSARDIAETIDAVGGEFNAFTSKEYTAFYLRVLSGDLPAGLDILCDIMSDPAFRADEIEAERHVILEEILMRGDDPGDLVHELCFEALYPGHPLGLETLGTEDSITSMTGDDIRSFFAHHYRPGNIVLSAAGYLDHDEFVAGIEARFDPPPGGAAPERDAPPPPEVPLVVDTRATEQAHIVVAMHALDRHDDDRYALGILNQILGGGMSSRLFQTIREDRGLAYSVYSYRSSFDQAGALSVYAGTAPTNVSEVIRLINEGIDGVLEDGVTQRELDVAKGHLRGTMALGLEDSAARMSRIGRSQLVHGSVLPIDELAARIEAVEVVDVTRVAKRVLANPRVLAAVGPFSETDVFTSARLGAR
jgi:predicted Zn-dependent peptidase